MSELEKARAGVFLTLLALTLTWLLLSNGDDHQSNAAATNPVLICASTHGAVCVAPVPTGNEPPYLGTMVVSASRLPADLGHLVVMASRLPDDSLAGMRLAIAEGKLKDHETTVVQ
jgi:hypothetical protein